MTPAEQGGAHDANWIAAMQMMARNAPDGWVDRVGDLELAFVGVPGSFFNGVWVTRDPDATHLSAAVDRLRQGGMPFAVHVRSGLEGASTMAQKLGLVSGGVLPCFALPPGPVPAAPAGLEIARVSPDTWDEFLELTAVGFEMPPEMVRLVYGQGILDEPDARSFVGRIDGSAAGTAVSIRTGDTLGIYSIATAPSFRGRGIGTAMTWHLMADADPGWTVAVLQASQMGRPIYERMGFRLVREFVEYTDPPA